MTGKHDKIAGSLIQDILSGRYRESERLPSERDLATRFDANRGAVREAMKKLEQIGLAEVQPGGARVKRKEEASLDVISHLLSQGRLPDAALIDQIMLVINVLISAAAEQALELASDDEIVHIRSLVRPLLEDVLDKEQHTVARFELMQALMLASGNLPLRLIAHTLFDQMAPSMTNVHPHVVIDVDTYRTFAEQLDQALSERDQTAMRAAFTAFSNLHRETLMRAFKVACKAIGPEAKPQ
ncbi:MAG: GntR family transcriptional repressor for pyruvate dehydrogenase complex [Oceanicoccus sp.]